MKLARISMATLLGSLLMASTGFAQSTRPPAAAPAVPAPAPAAPPAAPAPVSAEPQRTSASYGDWVLNCVRRTPSAATAECEVVQTIVVKGQTGPVAQLALGRTAPSEPLRLTLVLPSTVSLGSKPLIRAADDKPAQAELTWRRCLPGGCFSDMVLADADLKRLRTQGEAGEIVFKDAAEREVKISMSWRGLPQALDAMAKP